MKGFRCYFLSLLALSLLSVFIITSKDASAITLASNGANVYPTPGGSFYQKGLVGDGSQRLAGFLSGSDLVFAPTSQFGDPWGDWSQIGWDWNNPVPIYSVLSFSMTIQISAPGIEMYGFEFEQTVELANTCEDFFVGSNIYGTFHCDYLLLTRGNVDGLNSYVGARTAKLNYSAAYGNATYNIFVHPGSYITLTNDSLGPDDRNWLQQQLAAHDTDLSSVVAKINEVKSEQQATTRAIQAQTQQQHDDYESEVEREEAKEEELNEQKDDLNISAQNPGNPFANLFNVSGCVNLPVFSQWFHQDHVTQVCSPYPEQTRPVIEFVSSVIVIGLLIQIYFKNFKGGYAS